jgi:hypothetical protein
MSSQNFQNHGRYLTVWHFIIPALLLSILGFSIINLIHSDAHTHYSAVLLAAISIVLIVFWWYARLFALKAQDRAIRAEENLRHFILTGKALDSRLRMSQIVALRFASEAEFVALAKKAVEENLSQKEIKQEIKNWKADNNRV